MPARSSPAVPSVTVMHRCPVWLPQTQAWLYHQVRHLPTERVTSHVVCDDLAHLDQFPVPRLRAFKRQHRVRQLWDRSLRKLGLRDHLGLAIRVAGRENVQVIHSHFGTVGYTDLPVARETRIPHLVSFYGADASRYPQDPAWHQRFRELFARVDGVLAEGPHMLETLAGLGCPRDKLRVHRLGVPLERIPHRPRRWNGSEPLRILIAAGFREKKGIPLAIEALGRALPRLPDLEITLIGDADASAAGQREKRRIHEVLARTGLMERTRLAGLLPYRHLIGETYRHHLFLAPSRRAADGDSEGGAPLLLVELLASGMLGVASDHADIPQVLPVDCGLTVPENDVDALAEKLMALAAEPQQWKNRSLALRHRLERLFDADRQARALAEIYRDFAHA